MTRLRILAATAFALAAGCASVHATAVSSPTVSPSEAPPSPTATPTLEAAAPLWRYTLPAGWDRSTIRAGAHLVFAGGTVQNFALDLTSGHVRWQNREGASSALVGDSVIYGTASGAIVARSEQSGRLMWRASHVCVKPDSPSPIGGVDRIVRSGNDLIVGCNGGAIARINAANGMLLKRSNDFSVEQFNSIAPLGNCALALTGWSSGAILVGHGAIVDCRDLHTIVPERSETYVLGAIGNTAVLDDTCCNGRPDVYRPATIIHANLSSGQLSPEVDLTPEPQLYPADHRPIGQGAVAFLSRGHLFLAVDHAIYDYGDARVSPSKANRLGVTLVEPPIVLNAGIIFARVRDRDRIIDEIARIDDGTLRPIWRSIETGTPVIGPAPGAPNAILLYQIPEAQRVVRSDGSQLILPPHCQIVGSNDAVGLAICTTTQLVGDRYLQYLAAFRWQSPAAATAPRDAGL